MLSKTLGLFLRKDNRRPRWILGLVAAVILSTFAGAIPAAAQSLPLYVVDARSPVLRTMDPLTGETLTQINISMTGENVEGANGLAKDSAGTLFVMLELTGVSGRTLATLDPATGIATKIGNTGHSFAAITFDDTDTLWAVSGDGDIDPETLFTIDTTDGTVTLVVALGNGGSGEALAFNPEDGLLYHMSGCCNPVFETIDPADPLTAPVNIAITGDTIDEGTSIEHWSGDMFLVSDLSDDLFILKTSGESRFLSTADFSQVKGTVFAGAAPTCPPTAQLYGAANIGSDGPSLFYTLDPATGAATLVGPVGFERVSGIAFDGAGVLFGAGELQDGSDTPVGLNIDPCTGLGTELGPFAFNPSGDNITDLSFRPSDGQLFAWVESNDELATVDTGTGAVDLLGTNVNSFGGGLAIDSADTIFHADGTNLNILDATDGSVISFVPFVYPGVDQRPNALDFDPASGTLFASLPEGFPATSTFLATVDTTTGDVTIVGDTQLDLDAIAFNSQLANLKITKTISPTTPVVNTSVTYTVTVTNNGPADATNVIVVDTLPSSSVFTVGTITPSQGTCGAVSSGSFTCNLGAIANAGTATITITGTVIATGSSNLVNKVTVASDQFDPDTSDNTATRTSSVQTITVVVAPTSTTVKPGNDAIYNVVVRGSLTSAPNVDVALTCVNITGSVSITCSFSPATVNPGTTGGAAGSVLTVSTGAIAMMVPPGSEPQAPLYAVWLGLPALALVGMASFSGRRKRLALALALGLLLLSLLPLAGCNNQQQAVPPSTVTFKVQGASTPVTVTSDTVTLLVDAR